MEPNHSNTELSAVLLAFYECLTDSNQLDTLMEMLTSWLDTEDTDVISPKLEYHADRAWKLLAELSDDELHEQTDWNFHGLTRFADKSEVKEAIRDQLRDEDQARVTVWLESDVGADTLLLRVDEQQTTELVVLSRDVENGGYFAKRSGPEFQTIISKFVADSFELTNAEFTLVQELLKGGTLREIAARLGKSWETTRSQIKTLTNKLGVKSQSDVLRMVNQAATLMPNQPSQTHSPQFSNCGQVERPDGRTIVYEVDGGPAERTLVFLHGMTQGRHWPEQARALAMSRGWRIVRISRAGRGPSSLNAKEGEALLQDHIDDAMAVMDNEKIQSFSIFAAADGFAIGYALALQHPERVRMIVGLEVVPPILSRKATAGFSGKMKTFGLACLYAPKTVKFMFGFAMHKLDQMEDRYTGIHPLMGVELGKFEDAEGIRVDDLNFKDQMAHKADGMWRDASFSCVDWAHAPADSNLRPSAALVHSGNSMIKSPGSLDELACRIGAPLIRIESYFPYVSAALPAVLDALESPTV